jgi:basic amino acid/polyamine antiporter, APA family
LTRERVQPTTSGVERTEHGGEGRGRVPGRPLAQVVGVAGAVLIGLGSILGTGIFVSIGLAAEVAGGAVVLAVVLAGVVATFNGLSSAQLAAAHPRSGGTYEYGYRFLSPSLGFCAGWMFVAAKTASAATAALGVSAYLSLALGVRDEPGIRLGVALGAVVLLTALVAAGMRRSSRVNATIVVVTLAALSALVIAGARPTLERLGDATGALAEVGPVSLLHATALMFVAYTGYGRIATLGEEVRDPERSIPRAIVITLVLSVLLYVGVAAVAVGVLGSQALASATSSSAAPLHAAARALDVPLVAALVAIGAITAMLGVLLNLVLGVSRVVLAMARRGDLPTGLSAVDLGGSPRRAVLVTGAIVAVLVGIGDVRTTWSFSAFAVLVYYGITNLAALRLPPSHRRFPRVIAWLGLASCLSLAWFVEARVWIVGVVLLVLGAGWHAAARRRAGGAARTRSNPDRPSS